MPPAVQPGGKYELEKVSIRTGRPVASSSALDRASRVNGQWVASTMTPVAITPRSMTTLIQSHLGIGRYAAGEDCSMSTWKTRQFECGGSGKHRAVAAPRYWNWGCESRWRAIPPAAVAALGISRRPRPWLWGFLMRTSNRWDFHHCSRTVSVTISNRRVRTRTHGGVAGVGG